MAAASSTNGFNMSSLLTSLEASVAHAPRNGFNMSDMRSMLDSLTSSAARVKTATTKAKEIKRHIERKPRSSPADERLTLKIGRLQRQLDIENDSLARVVRRMTRLLARPSNAAEQADLERDIDVIKARIAHITSEINNPESEMNLNNGRQGRSMSRSMSPSSMRRGKSRNRNNMNNNNRNRSPRRGGATRKRRNL
jgi:hypothetical protein